MEIIKVIVDKLPASCSECGRAKTLLTSKLMCGLNNEWLHCDPFEQRGILCPLEQTELEEN